MVDKEFYAALRQYLANRSVTPLDQCRRKKVMRVAENFVLKDNQLFYTGPSRHYMRLVVQSEEQKLAVLQECHYNSGRCNHNGVRRTRDRVVAGYYWSTIKADVTDWVKSCPNCQLNRPIKTVAPVLHPFKVKEPWEVVGMDFIGPLRETEKKNRYVFTMTDLYTKWVVAEPMQTKSASEVSAVLISKMYLFGMVRKIISDQGREFVNQLNSRIFEVLNIKQVVSSGYHPPAIEQDEHINHSIMRAIRKYANKEHDDWDVHLQAIIYGINTTKHSSTQHSPYFLLFHRHPHLPEMINACPIGETFEVQHPEDELDQKSMDIKAINKKVLCNLERLKSQQKKGYPDRKHKRVRQCSMEADDKMLISENPKNYRVGEPLQDRQDPEMNAHVMKLEHSYSLSYVNEGPDVKVES